MKIFGYKENDDSLMELQEVSLQCDLKELDKIIEFLKDIKKQHGANSEETELCHSHFSDWDKNWKNGQTDIIIATKF